jgi:anti-sigma B factor antagonist
VSLTLSRRLVGDVTVITCAGRIVLGQESESLQACLDETLPMSTHVLLHLGGVDFIDSGGLGMLARYLTRAQNAGGALKLCALSRKVDDVLRITRLKAVFQIYDTEADSIADVHDASDRESSLGRPDILCVDPSVDVLAYLRELLKQSGYRMLTASNLPDALILLKTTGPRVVVVGSDLRAAGATWTAQEFNRIANQGAVVELPSGFSGRDAGDAALQLLEAIHAIVPSKNADHLPPKN